MSGVDIEDVRENKVLLDEIPRYSPSALLWSVSYNDYDIYLTDDRGYDSDDIDHPDQALLDTIINQDQPGWTDDPDDEDNKDDDDLDLIHDALVEGPTDDDVRWSANDWPEDVEALELALDQPLTTTPLHVHDDTATLYHWWLITHHLPLEGIQRYPSFPWSQLALSQRSKTTAWEAYHGTIAIGPKVDFNDRHVMSSRLDLTLAMIDAFDTSAKQNGRIYGEWNWDAISLRSNPEEVRKDPSRPWSRTQLSYNPKITLRLVYDYLTKDRLPKATDGWDFVAILSRAQDISVAAFTKENRESDRFTKENDLDFLDPEEIRALIENPALGPGLFAYLCRKYPSRVTWPKVTPTTRMILLYRYPQLINRDTIEAILNNHDLTVSDIYLLGLVKRWRHNQTCLVRQKMFVDLTIQTIR